MFIPTKEQAMSIPSRRADMIMGDVEAQQIKFHVPTHYTVGDAYDTFEEAAQAAEDTIVDLDGLDRQSRAFVDVRVYDSQGNRPVYRTEIFR